MYTLINFLLILFRFEGEISTEDPITLSINLNELTVILTNNYLSIFNITQTPYTIFEEYITDLLWPQTNVFGDSSICQPSELIPANTHLDWMLSENKFRLQNNSVYKLTSNPCRHYFVQISRSRRLIGHNQRRLHHR